MIKLALRFVAVLLLLIIIIMDDFPFYEKMKDTATQLFLAIFIIAFVYYDTTFGFIMGLVLILIYYEIYKKIIMRHEKMVKESHEKYEDRQRDEVTPSSISQSSHNYIPLNEIPSQLNYISQEHLLAAQNNVFDIDNYKTEVKGIKHGFNNEKVYGVQGLDSDHVNYIGYNNEEMYADVLEQ